jgi:hypothetical protein
MHVTAERSDVGVPVGEKGNAAAAETSPSCNSSSMHCSSEHMAFTKDFSKYDTDGALGPSSTLAYAATMSGLVHMTEEWPCTGE